MKGYNYILGCGLLMWSVMLLQGCAADKEIGVDPYAGGKAPLGVLFTSAKADPTSGLPGEVVRVDVRGLKQYENMFKVLLNEVESEVVELTDSTLDIRIPQQVSSGTVSVELNGQYFIGPRVGVEGKASVDTDFKITNGYNSYVNQVIPHAGGFLVVGSFNNFENEASTTKYINGIHLLNSLGQSATSMDFRRGATGSILSIAKLSNGQFMIGGSLSGYSRRSIGALTRLNANGSLDSLTVAVINPDSENKPLDGFDTVATFNGGLQGSVINLFPTAEDGVIAVGSFANHYRIDYNYSSRENKRFIYSKVAGVAKLRMDGSLDSSFNYNNAGFNGFINNAIQLNDGRIIVVGKFSSYNGVSANNIVCILPSGEIDRSFTAAGGSDNTISAVTYNAVLDQVVLAGNFKNYGGVPTQGVVVLNAQGQIDPTFKLGVLGEGNPSYAYVLNNGKVLVYGSFNSYNHIRRGNLLVLERDGTAEQAYNNLGSFSGIPMTILETTSSLGNPAVLIGGLIFAVDGKNAGNLVKIELKN